MGQIDQLKPSNNMSDLEEYTLHAVRQTLKAMNTYHAVWHVEINQCADDTLEVTAWIPERITMPAGYEKPVVPIHFRQKAKTMRDFLDVEFWALSRELSKEINKAMQLGKKYGRAV